MSTAAYRVVLLVERELSDLDAAQVMGLHDGIEEPVAYHVVLPVENPSAHVHAALGSIARYEVVPPADAVSPELLAQLDADLVAEATQSLDRSTERLRARGRAADGELCPGNPVRSLVRIADQSGAREAIVLTEPHAVRDFLHVDWASRARRSLGIPILHLLEHETFAEQAGGGEGISGA